MSDQSGATGPAMQTDAHTSATMHDYPVIADVDADGHAEIVVAHHGFTSAFSVFGDSAWAPARSLWNQHAYSVTNIEDTSECPSPRSTSAGMTSEAVLFELSAADIAPCDALQVVPVDPVGGASCPEDLAAATVAGAFCP